LILSKEMRVLAEPVIKRQYYQIYVETERLPFDGFDRTKHTLRAAVIQCLAPMRLREVIFQPRSYDYEQNIIRVSDPEAEVKYGIDCRSFYLQVSVSDEKNLKPVFVKVMTAIKLWAQKGD